MQCCASIYEAAAEKEFLQMRARVPKDEWLKLKCFAQSSSSSSEYVFKPRDAQGGYHATYCMQD